MDRSLNADRSAIGKDVPYQQVRRQRLFVNNALGYEGMPPGGKEQAWELPSEL
jgi:hypothetical protein